MSSGLAMHSSNPEAWRQLKDLYNKKYNIVRLKKPLFTEFNPFYYSSYDEFERSIRCYNRVRTYHTIFDFKLLKID